MSADHQLKNEVQSFDLTELNALSDSIGADNIPAMLDSILELTPQVREDLRAACAEGDRQRIARVAHKMKSSCGYLGAHGLIAALAALEAMEHGNDAVEIENAISSVVSLLDNFQKDVHRVKYRWPY